MPESLRYLRYLEASIMRNYSGEPLQSSAQTYYNEFKRYSNRRTLRIGVVARLY